jgi:hypothetical protein
MRTVCPTSSAIDIMYDAICSAPLKQQAAP